MNVWWRRVDSMWRWVADRKQVRRPPDEASPHAPHLQADPIEPATGEPARREPWLNLPPRFSAHPAAERLVNVLADQRQRMAGAAQHLSPVKTAASWLRPQRPILALAMTGAGAVAAGVVWLGGLMGYYWLTMPHPSSLAQRERAPVIRVLAQDGQVLAERGAAHDYMPLAMLPEHVVRAVVATEDRRFYEHIGVDPAGLARALFANMRAGRYAQGGSTITQQLAKNLFLSSDRTLGRKFDELALSLWLELRLAKSDILELYLNRVYFGGGAYGIESAAQRYFQKSARELTIAEAALIAGLLKAPSRYSPASNPGLARTRGRVVLKAMLDSGVITAAQEKRAQRQQIRFSLQKSERDSGGVEYLVDLVLDRLPPLLGSGHAEVVVETTLDADLQRRVQGIVKAEIDKRGEALEVSQAALVLLDLDGGVRAMVGGRSYAESQFNRAVKAKRQPGSAFKPVVYLAAVESGMRPDSVAYDLPLNINGWAPRNENGQHRGAVTLREAMAHSINTVAVRLMLDAGTQRVMKTAKRLGIKSELAEQPSMALGASELTLTELTGAYAVLANGGFSIEPHAIKRVRISSGRILYVRDVPRLTQVVAAEHVAAINDMLHEVMVSGTGRRAAIAAHMAAGKTGTTQDFRDAWFVGYTGHFVGGVWVGNDNGRPMNKVTGGSLPADIWREAMKLAHQGRAALTLPGLEIGRRPVAVASVRPPSHGGVPAAAVPQVAEKREGVARAKSEPRRVTKASPRLPTERIGEDFIARAMKGLGDEPPPLAVAEDTFVVPRIVNGPQLRPAGAMGLGVVP